MGPRSASPVDAAGSPLGSTNSPLHSPGVYDGMASGNSSSNNGNRPFNGQPHQQQNELSNEFQKFTMVRLELLLGSSISLDMVCSLSLILSFFIYPCYFLSYCTLLY